MPLSLDITQRDDIQKVAEMASNTQILVNNAGCWQSTGALLHDDEQKVRQEIEVNYFGPLHLIQVFSQHMIERGEGVFVNVISIGGLYPSPQHMTYSSSKATLYSLTQALRIEMRMKGHAMPLFRVYLGPIET